MEYSLVFLGERNRRKVLEEISSTLNIPFSSCQVVFLTNKTVKKEDFSKVNKNLNFKTLVFENFSTNESMFEYLIQQPSIGNVILFKESAVNINFKDVNRMIEQRNKKNSLLVVSKSNKKQSLWKKIFSYVKDFLAKIFLNIHFFESNADIMLFDRLLVATMQEMPGKSAALTKINAWAGITPVYIGTEEQPTQKMNYSIKDFTSIIITATVFLGLIATDIVLGVLGIKLHFILLLLLIAAHIVVIIVLLYIITKKLFKIKFGDVGVTNEARVKNEFDNFDE